MGRRVRNVAAIAGLVATGILAAGLLVVVVNRNSTAAPASSPSGAGAPQAYTQVQWHATKVQASSSLSPYLAVSNGRLYMVTDDRQGDSRGLQLWSSADAIHWEQATDLGVDPDFVARAATADGSGGLIVVGELTPTDAAVVPQIWHSTDGRTFARARVEPPGPGSAPGTSSGEIVAVATAAGQMAAFGDHDIVDMTKGAPEVRGLDSWLSTDGSTWTHSDLAGSDGYSAISMTAWSGGFAALASQPGTDAGYGVWLSADGVAWHKVESVSTFGADSIVALPDRLVVVGSNQDTGLGMVPASWSSADGAAWTESKAPVSGFGAMFDAACVLGSSVVAIGVSHVGSTDRSGGPNPSSLVLVPPTTWISNDGSPWQVLGAAPAYAPYMTSMATFDGHVVLAVVTGAAEVTVSVGDLT